MNLCPQCQGPIPKDIDESTAAVEYSPHCDFELYQRDRSGPEQWLPREN